LIVDPNAARWRVQFETILDGTSQDVVFLKTCQELCDNALMGYNGTIFAYGQVRSPHRHSSFACWAEPLGTARPPWANHALLLSISTAAAESKTKP
jgi:hypothetical protein